MELGEWYSGYLETCKKSCEDWIHKYDQKKEALLAEYKQTRERLTEAEEAGDENLIRSLEAQIVKIQEDNRKLQASSAKGMSLLKRLERGELDEPFEELRKNPKIANLRVSSPYLRVTTSNLSYKGPNAPGYEGKDIGQFEIHIPYDRPSEPDVENLTYSDGSRGHWSFSEDGRNHPCYGAWSNSITKPLGSAGLVEGIELMIIFLETAGDEGAYCSAEGWMSGID